MRISSEAYVERFQQGYYQCSSNYRMVDQVVGRVLGRPVHGDAERRAWSIVIGEKGFTAFVDAVLDSPEYMESFGYDLVPQQRSRVLPGRSLGEMPIYQQFPRYGADWRDACRSRSCSDQDEMQQLEMSSAWVNGQPAWALKLWLGLAVVGGFELGRVVLTMAGSMFAVDSLDGAFQPAESGHWHRRNRPGLKIFWMARLMPVVRTGADFNWTTRTFVTPCSAGSTCAAPT